MNGEAQNKKEPVALIAFYAACCATIALNAGFLGDMVSALIHQESAEVRQWIFPALITAALVCLNVLELINNWVSIKKYIRYYNFLLLFVDILTLGLYFLQVHTASGLLPASNEETLAIGPILLDFMFFYCLIFALYIVWSSIVLRNDRVSGTAGGLCGADRKKIGRLITTRTVQLVLSFFCCWAYLTSSRYAAGLLAACVILSYAGLLVNSKGADIFHTLIQPAEL